MAYTAYVLTERSRRNVLIAYPPKFPVVRAHHVTLQFGVPRDTVAPTPARIEVIGYAHDDSLEALVVTVNSKCKRDDGSVYHITLSHAEGRKPVESNAVIAANGWRMSGPYGLETVPEVLK
jgi:hypothetical protein